MSNEQPNEADIEALEILGKYLATLLESSDLRAEEKQSWLALVPFMEMKDLFRLMSHLESQVAKQLVDSYKEEVDGITAVIKRYEEGRQTRKEETLDELDALEKELAV